MSAELWSNVQVAVQSALATAVTISGITKASPAVVSYASGTDPVNGDFVRLSVQGMSELDNRIFRVANANGAGNTFELEGCDSTLFNTFSSGTFEVITLGTTLSIVSGVNVSGGDFAMIDVTTIHDNVNKQIPGNANPVQINFDCLWDPSDAGLVALKAASDARAMRAIKITWPSGKKVIFMGYIGATAFPTGSAQQKVSTPVTISAYGRPTAYAT